MATVIATPLTVASADKFPVVPIANGIVPDEALAITVNLQFSPTVQAILVDLSESARKFNTIPIQGAFIDTSGSAIDLRIDNSVTGQSVLAKAGLQGYYNLLCPMPAKLIAVLASAPGAQLNITMILYNTVIESEVWGLTSGPAGPTGPQGPPGATGATGPQGPAGTITPATATVLGGVKIGANVTVQADGTISVAAPYTLPIATSTVLGGVKAGTGVSIAGDGTISAPVLAPATNTVLGGVKIGTNVSVLGDGTISVPVTSAFQTPWLANENAANFTLTNVSQVGIGTASPARPLDIVTTNSTSPGENIRNYTANPATYPGSLYLMTARGTAASPLTLSAGDNMGYVSFDGYTTTNGFVDGAGITGVVTAITATTVTSDMAFSTNTGTAGPSVEHMRLTSAGYLGIGLTAPQVPLEVNGATRITNSTGNFTSGQGIETAYYPGIPRGGFQTYNHGTSAWTEFNIDGNPLSLNYFSGGKVGVGTRTPSALLEVKLGTITEPTTAATWAGIVYNATNGPNSNGLLVTNNWSATTSTILDVGNTSGTGTGVYTSYLQVLGNGFVGIGISPGALLQLGTDSAVKPTTNTWTIASGAKVKRKVKRLKGGLEIINKLSPTEAEYNGRGGTPEGQRVVSLIAEEVREILPHTVTEDADGNLGFNIHEVIHHLVLAVQQLSKKLEKMEAVA